MFLVLLVTVVSMVLDKMHAFSMENVLLMYFSFSSTKTTHEALHVKASSLGAEQYHCAAATLCRLLLVQTPCCNFAAISCAPGNWNALYQPTSVQFAKTKQFRGCKEPSQAARVYFDHSWSCVICSPQRDILTCFDHTSWPIQMPLWYLPHLPPPMSDRLC